MCGIAGFVGSGNQEILEKMTNILRHRGPDDVGFFIEGNVGFGHRRLSIIDLQTGRQPIFSEDKSVAVIFNGEIYNFLELKKELETKGHRFSTNTDTEVIVHLYEEVGEKVFERLNGMFAIALYDKKSNKLLLARDRLGEKPLHYALFNDTFIFGSEIKTILQHPAAKREIDFFSLNKYLVYEYVPCPATIFKNIYKLPAGQYLVFQKGKIEIKTYWDISFNKYEELSEPEYLDELDKRLEESVRKRLVSDVPLGVFLSGGLDSTTVSYYAQKASMNPIKTFCIGFDDPSFDESNYASKAAKFLKTDHYQKILTPNDLLNLIPHISEMLDEPLADASIIPTYLLSKFTREKVTVALGGDGGDELFAGYPTFQSYKLAKLYQKIPNFFRLPINSVINHLPTSFDNISFDFMLKRFILGQEFSPEIRNQIWLSSFLPAEVSHVFSPESQNEISKTDAFSDISAYLKKMGSQSEENRLIYLYLKQYLQDDILVKVDRAAMFASLEVRAPFLNHTFVDFVNSIPFRYKLKGWTTKYLLKKIMADKLPKEIVNRRKKGFGIPVAKWIRGELKDFVLDILSEDQIKKGGLFNYRYVNFLLQEHFSGKTDNRKKIWTLLMFQLWQQKWLK